MYSLALCRLAPPDDIVSCVIVPCHRVQYLAILYHEHILTRTLPTASCCGTRRKVGNCSCLRRIVLPAPSCTVPSCVVLCRLVPYRVVPYPNTPLLPRITFVPQYLVLCHLVPYYQVHRTAPYCPVPSCTAPSLYLHTRLAPSPQGCSPHSLTPLGLLAFFLGALVCLCSRATPCLIVFLLACFARRPLLGSFASILLENGCLLAWLQDMFLFSLMSCFFRNRLLLLGCFACAFVLFFRTFLFCSVMVFVDKQQWPWWRPSSRAAFASCPTPADAWARAFTSPPRTARGGCTTGPETCVSVDFGLLFQLLLIYVRVRISYMYLVLL